MGQLGQGDQAEQVSWEGEWSTVIFHREAIQGEKQFSFGHFLNRDGGSTLLQSFEEAFLS